MATVRRVARVHAAAWLVTAMLIGLLPLAVAGSAAAGENPFPSEWFWGDEKQRKQQDAMIGRPMPDLRLSEWINGPIKKRDLRGKIVVVDFWATWCGPCIRSIPHNNEMMEKYADDGVLILGVCGSSRGQDRMAAVAKEHDIRYPVARDATQRSAKAWRVMWWPTYAVVDRKGVVRAVGLQPNFVDDVVDIILEEQPMPEGEDGGEALAEEDVTEDTFEPFPAEFLEGDAGRRARLAEIEGQEAPPLEVRAWMNAQGLSKKKLEGKVILVDFWATWCGPCIRAIPKANAWQEKYVDEGLVVIGVCHSRGAENMGRVAKQHNIRYPIAADVDGATVKAYMVDSFPDYYLIDRAGRLRGADLRAGKVEEAIQVLLAEAPPEQEDDEGDDAVASAE